MRIMKFGGMSLETKEKTQKICEYIKKIYKKEKQLIIVVSAMGKTTNNLISKAHAFSNNNPLPRELDKLLSIGELESASLFSMMLNSIGVPSKSFDAYTLNIKCDGEYQNSKISSIDKSVLDECLKEKIVSVVAGFQGVNSSNELCTLGRGGSDTTAVAIGVLFNHCVEIYSNYDGIYMGDPSILNFKKIKHINLNTMLLMSESGVKVIDQRAVKLAKNKNIEIISKSSSKPNKKGTIVNQIESNIISISSNPNLSLISIVFDDNDKIKIIMKNVLFLAKKYKIYNLTHENNLIKFLIKQEFEHEVLLFLSKKLKLLK